MLLLNYLSKKVLLASLLMLQIGCSIMHACSSLSFLSQPDVASWGSKLRISLPTSFSSAWEKSRDSFNALPTGYKYAVGGGAGLLLAGSAFLGYKKFAAQKQTFLSNSAHVITASGNSDPVAAYLDQFTAVGHQKNLPIEGGFIQFQNASDIGPTQVLQAARKDIYVGIEESAHHWSVLVNSGANPFAPSIVENEVNAFVSLANKFEPQFILTVVQYGRGIYRQYPKQALFTPDEIKAGIKATLVQLLAKDGFEAEFNNIVDIVGNACTKPEIAFTYADWQELLNRVDDSAGLGHIGYNQSRYDKLKELAELPATSKFSALPSSSSSFVATSDNHDMQDVPSPVSSVELDHYKPLRRCIAEINKATIDKNTEVALKKLAGAQEFARGDYQDVCCVFSRTLFPNRDVEYIILHMQRGDQIVANYRFHSGLKPFFEDALIWLEGIFGLNVDGADFLSFLTKLSPIGDIS